MSLVIGSTTSGNATGPNVNINHNNDGNLLLVAVHCTGAPPTVVGYGVAMSAVVAAGGGFTGCYIYKAINPPLGVNAINVVGDNQRYDVAAISFKGADPTLGAVTTAANFSGAPATLSVSPASYIGDIVIAFLRTANPSVQPVTLTAGTSQITGEIAVATIAASSPTSTITWQGTGAYSADAAGFAIRTFRSGAFLLNLIN